MYITLFLTDSFSIFITPVLFLFQEFQHSGPDSVGVIRWDYGLAMGILGTICTWLFWKLDRIEKEHQERIKNIVKAHNMMIDRKDEDLKELNDKVLDAFVAVQTTLSIVGENNNTLMDKLQGILNEHLKSIELLIKNK